MKGQPLQLKVLLLMVAVVGLVVGFPILTALFYRYVRWAWETLS